ncbi:hypothetical protein RRG08_007358 [Elysia crispata]|uniref:Uncharacterized protein n=1 Tax=Elysia crispata TaxID=231223 RepID=A0AAE1AQU4_9GAST|nr:hypothetical protein RRG08_007358 [Elysia crispata]
MGDSTQLTSQTQTDASPFEKCEHRALEITLFPVKATRGFLSGGKTIDGKPVENLLRGSPYSIHPVSDSEEKRGGPVIARTPSRLYL